MPVDTQGARVIGRGGPLLSQQLLLPVPTPIAVSPLAPTSSRPRVSFRHPKIDLVIVPI